MICRHSGQLTHWFTSDRGDWEIRWCERCGGLQKFNLFKKKLEWIFPQWTEEYKKLLKSKSFGGQKVKISKKKKTKKTKEKK